MACVAIENAMNKSEKLDVSNVYSKTPIEVKMDVSRHFSVSG
jgi:hypothetical protein